MAKQIDLIKLLVEGDTNGASTAKFTYRVCDTDDSNMRKMVHYTVNSPVFSADTIDEFFDGYVSVFETNEGIS